MVHLDMSVVEMTVLVLFIATLFRLRMRLRMAYLAFLGDIPEHNETHVSCCMKS